MMAAVLCVSALVATSTGPWQPDAGKAAPTMKAVRIHQFGSRDELKYEDAPKPTPAAGEVLIEIHAAGVNPVDWKIRSGKFGSRGMAFPIILGFDISGRVVELGSGVTALKPGDEVFAYGSLSKGGGYAEFIAMPANTVTKKPASIDHVHAAGVPLAALTAWQALFDTAKLKAGQTVLIHAGAGGVGHFAVQLAKAKGAKVIATASDDNLPFLKEIGADQVIDYKVQKFEDVAKDVDVVLDSIGGDTQQRSMGVLKEGGFLVSIVGAPDPKKLEEHKIKGAGILVKPDAAELTEIASLIDSGKVKPHVSAVVPLDNAKRAHELSESNKTRGKIVLKVK